MNTIDLDIDTPIYGTPVKKEPPLSPSPKAPQELEERDGEIRFR